MQEIQQDLNMDLDAFPTQKAESDADFDALLSDVRQLLEQDEPIPEPEEPIVEEAAPEGPVPDLEPAPADTDEDDRLEELLQRWIPEEPELPETADEASAQPQISMEQGPVVSADEVQIDYNRFYGETPPEPEPAAPIPEPEVPLQLPKLTFYEQSRPAYQSARRAEYERSREAQIGRAHV